MDIAPIKSIKSEKIQDQVYEQLKTLLLEGHWKAGDKLPSEAELCRMTGVSRVSVRAALKSLTAQGFLVSKQGEGTFVVDVSVDMNMELLVPIIGLDKKSILEVLEYRKILEVGIVPQILQNLTEEDLTYLEENVRSMEKLTDDQIESNAEIDLAFHRKLCIIAGNSLIIKVNHILGRLFRKSMEDVVLALGNRRGRTYHRKILEALKQRDLAQTESILSDHLRETIECVREAKLPPHG